MTETHFQPPLAIDVATAADAPAIRFILDDACAWLAARSIAQWTTPFRDEWIAERIARGEFVVARLANEPVAVVRLIWADPLFWVELECGDAGYLHTLGVRRAFAGQGIGARIVAWAANEARARGRRYLRLDCTAENERLCTYYHGLGFCVRGLAVVGSEKMLLFEKELEREWRAL